MMNSGVHHFPALGIWRACFHIRHAKIVLGPFDSRQDAEEALVAEQKRLSAPPTLAGEVWITPARYPNHAVSSHGRVWSMKYGKILRGRLKAGGYIAIKINGVLTSVHRLVATFFIPNPLNKPCVNHIDCCPGNNHVNNLEWVSYKENSEHTVRMGRTFTASGSKNQASKLHESEALEIRRLYESSGMTQKEIGRKFGVSQRTVSLIVRREKWTHV